jgi:hypothetical protein
MTTFGTGFRELRGALATAPDRALVRIVGVLDGVEDRGAADELLDGIRRRLRPFRPLRFTRLLAMPLEGALVAPARYRGDPAEIPRSALTPLAAAVAAVLGDGLREIEAALEGRTTADHGLIGELGSRLWPAAGKARVTFPDAAWRGAGLPLAAQAPVLSLAGALWRHGAALWDARQRIEAITEAELHAALGRVRDEGPPAFLAATRLLMRVSGVPGTIARLAAGLVPTAGPAIEEELRAVLLAGMTALGQPNAVPEVAEGARILRRQIEDTEACDPPAGRDDRRGEIARIRQLGATMCCARLEAELRDGLLLPLGAHLAAGPGAASLPGTLEPTARDLRRLEITGRQLGNEAAFARVIDAAVADLASMGPKLAGVRRVEVARLVEILAGRDAAAAVLRAEDREGVA